MVTLPEEIYHRFQVSAHVMQQSMEDLLAQSIQGNLPPSIEDLPPELQNEIGLFLQSLTSQALWEIVKAPSLPATWQRQQELLEKKSRGNVDSGGNGRIGTVAGTDGSARYVAILCVGASQMACVRPVDCKMNRHTDVYIRYAILYVSCQLSILSSVIYL